MTELRHKSNRHIVKRIIVRGTLVLDTPTCLGSGDAESPTDLPLLKDSISNHALLTGSSIAGALRNYLRERNKGYGESDIRNDIATKLFGDLFSYKNEQNITDEAEKINLREQDTQSPLIIDDAISTQPIKAELRDGVKINSVTRTAAHKAKYDLELLQAGTEFTLSFELLIEREDKETTLVKVIATEMQLVETSSFATFFFKWLAYRYKNKFTLLKALAIALSGLKQGEISLGMKKRRGFGRCHVEEWQVWEFDLRNPKEQIEWLKFDHWTRELSNKRKSFESIVVALGGISLKQHIDKRERLFIHATFKLASPLLIRSGQDLIQNKFSPDVVHLHSQRNGKLQPIVSGTSLAGVLWHRAERIVNTLGKDLKIVYDLFGKVDEKTKEAKASRLVIDESVIENTAELVQSRIAIDRFTGGAYHGALFSEQPIFGIEKAEEKKKNNKGKEKSKPPQKHIELKLELRKPKEYEIGLLLLLLKDLWTQDLPIGGTSSIGRGRLQGVEATITWQQPEKSEQKWIISQNTGKLEFAGEDKQKLEDFVRFFVEKTA